MNVQTLNKALGNIDIYLLDQILKGRYEKGNKILDAGCGEGRNMIYFLNNQFDVFGIDKNESALNMLRFLTRSIDPSYDQTRISIGNIDKLPYEDWFFDHIICSAVLHFAQNESHFEAMIRELVRVLKPEGSIFIRMASNIGLENKVKINPSIRGAADFTAYQLLVKLPGNIQIFDRKSKVKRTYHFFRL